MEPVPGTTILVAVDFEPCSRAALTVARELAEARRAPLVVVHVVTGASVGGPERLALRAAARGRAPDELAVADAARRLEEFLRASGAPAGHERTRVEVGAPAERICEAAHAEHARTVVIGTHGRGRLGHALLGSVAREVMGTLTCRVIAVHDPGAAAPPERA